MKLFVLSLGGGLVCVLMFMVVQCAPICVLLFMIVRLYAGKNMGFHRSQLTSVTCKLATETYQADLLYDLQISGKSLTNKKL